MSEITHTNIRMIFLYEWQNNTKAAEVARKVNVAFGEGTTSEKTVRNWFHRFEAGETNIEDRPRSGRPSVLEDSALLNAIKEEPEITVRALARRFGCVHKTIENRLHALGCRKVSTRWIVD